MSFNPHTHAGCDRNAPLRTPPTVGFNPHTHAGCDKGFTLQLFRRTVSIHTPTQQGVTPGRSIKSSMCRFQSTHPRRVWHSPLWYPRLSMPVSIHTPTQGVTNITIRTGSIHSFNPHTHAGCDNFDLIDMFDFRVSIHTPTQGVTRREMVLYSFSWVSIHTPTQGVTHPYRWRFQSVYVSIHTPTQGVTQSGNRNKQGRHVSIHTPTQGVTLQNYPTVQMK